MRLVNPTGMVDFTTMSAFAAIARMSAMTDSTDEVSK
jgi:hypothetical protein